MAPSNHQNIESSNHQLVNSLSHQFIAPLNHQTIESSDWEYYETITDIFEHEIISIYHSSSWKCLLVMKSCIRVLCAVELQNQETVNVQSIVLEVVNKLLAKDYGVCYRRLATPSKLTAYSNHWASVHSAHLHIYDSEGDSSCY